MYTKCHRDKIDERVVKEEELDMEKHEKSQQSARYMMPQCSCPVFVPCVVASNLQLNIHEIVFYMVKQSE